MMKKQFFISYIVFYIMSYITSSNSFNGSIKSFNSFQKCRDQEP